MPSPVRSQYRTINRKLSKDTHFKGIAARFEYVYLDIVFKSINGSVNLLTFTYVANHENNVTVISELTFDGDRLK